jgi:multicomponent Na+:H+ antiporter subunit D
MTNADLAILQILLPLGGVVFALAAKMLPRRRAEGVLEWIAAGIGLFLPLVLLVFLFPPVLRGGMTYAVGNRGSSLGIIQHYDGLSWLLDLMGFSSLGIVWIYTRGAGPRGGIFTLLFLIQASAMASIDACGDLFNLFISFEVLGIANYALVALSGKPKAFFAAFNYLAISSASLTFFLLGVFGFYRLTGFLSYEGILQGLNMLPDGGGRTAAFSLACIAAAALVRVALMPLAGWLPDAHSSAPHAVTAVGCGMLLKPPLFALGRFLYLLSSSPGPAAEIALPLWRILGILGVLTAAGGVIFALCQSDAKRLLAYHSISQIGYVVSALALASPLGFAAAFLHSFFHSIFKGLLFLSLGCAVDAGNNRDVYRYRGAASILAKSGDKRRITLICFCIGALSIAAIPPLSGFASKYGVLHVLDHSPWQYWTLTLVGVGTMASMIKLSRIFWGRPGENTPPEAAAESSAAQGSLEEAAKALPQYSPDHKGGVKPFKVNFPIKLAMILWAAPCVLFGLFALPLGDFAARLIPGGKNPISSDLFSPPSLLKTGILILGSIILYIFLTRPLGQRISHRIRDLPKGFYQLIFGFVLALFIFSI